MDHFTNETATWIEDQFDQGTTIELELGSLIAAASDWTEDESEMDDLLSGLIESLLFGVSALDSVTFLAVSGVVLFVAFATAYLPARRAARLDPVESLQKV